MFWKNLNSFKENAVKTAPRRDYKRINGSSYLEEIYPELLKHM